MILPIIWLVIVIIAALGVIITFPELLDSFIGYGIVLIAILICLFPFLKNFHNAKSYVTLYDDYIIGFTMPKEFSLFSAPDTCEFRLDYSEITHVAMFKGAVEIYCQKGVYLVQATGCEKQVFDIINSKIPTGDQ